MRATIKNIVIETEWNTNDPGRERTPQGHSCTVSVTLYLCFLHSFHHLYHFVLITHPRSPVKDDCEPI